MLKTKLRDYQEEAVERATEPGRTGFAIFSEPRSGKTLMAIAIADRIRPHKLLIICPKKAIRVWEEQIERHWDWDSSNLYIEIWVLNYEQVLPRRHELKKWVKNNRSMVVVDESHRIKRRGSKQSRACRLIGKYADYRLALTGTPLSKDDSVIDAWAQFDFIDSRIFGRYSDKLDKKTKEVLEEGFETRFLIKGGFRGKKIVGYKNKKEFYRLFHTNSFRRTLREVRDKPLIIRRVKEYQDMDDFTNQHYRSLEKQLVTVIRKKNLVAEIRVKLVVSLSTKLQQLTGGWVIRDIRRQDVPIRIGKGKELRLLTLLSRFPKSKKLVVCVRYIHEIDSLKRAIERTGRTVKTIQGGIDFDGKFDTDVILVQIQSGLAIDLSASDTIIWYSWDFSYLNHEQMRFRVLSYKTRKITYYYLIMRDTIDEEIYEAIKLKKKLADLVCDHYRKRKNREFAKAA